MIDLASNPAGAEARKRTLALKEAAPMRTFFARVRGDHTEERAWGIGADGEEKVAAQLRKAVKKDPRWRIVNAVPIGNRGADIDHIVIGPGGIFTVNTKHLPGKNIWIAGDKFVVNGKRRPYVRKSSAEAGRVSKLLSKACGFTVRVEGIIVLVNPGDVTVDSAPVGVHVVPKAGIAEWLLGRPQTVDDDTQRSVYDMARRSTVWRPPKRAR